MSIQRVISYFGFGLAALVAVSFQGYVFEHDIVVRTLAN